MSWLETRGMITCTSICRRLSIEPQAIGTHPVSPFAAMAIAMAIEVWAGREESEPQAAVSAIIGLRGFGGVEAKAVGRRLRTFLFQALDTNCHPPT